MKTLEEIAKILLIFGLILGTSDLSAGWRPYRIQHHNVTAYSLSDKVAFNASIIRTGRKHTAVAVYLEVKKEIARPIVRIEIYVDSGNGLIDMKYINETGDACRFLRDKSYLPLAQIFYKSLVENGNFPTSCPLKKMVYKVERSRFNVEKLPPTLPNKTFMLGVFFSNKEGSTLKPLFSYRLITQIVNN